MGSIRLSIASNSRSFEGQSQNLPGHKQPCAIEMPQLLSQALRICKVPATAKRIVWLCKWHHGQGHQPMPIGWAERFTNHDEEPLWSAGWGPLWPSTGITPFTDMDVAHMLTKVGPSLLMPHPLHATPEVRSGSLGPVSTHSNLDNSSGWALSPAPCRESSPEHGLGTLAQHTTQPVWKPGPLSAK